MLIKENSTVLLQGDSITDAGRTVDPLGMGTGYPNILSAMMTALYPEKNIKFINRGISGNRVKDLNARWKQDCIDLKPDWLSILIGINDCWRRYDSNDPTSVEQFYNGYKRLLDETRAKLPATKIILLEPFVLHINDERASWREDLDPKINAVRKLAHEYKTLFVPLDSAFASASIKSSPKIWATDGVHPTQAGAALIANEWLKAVKAL